MKVKDIIKKWQDEGVSDEIIRKRLIVLTQKNKKGEIYSEFDETQDHEFDESIKTQTQLDVPIAYNEDAPSVHSYNLKNTQRLLYFLLSLNLIVIFIFSWKGFDWSKKINTLKKEVEALKKQSEKP